MDRKEIRWEGKAMDLIDVAQDKDVSGFCDHGNEISCSIKYRNYLTGWRFAGFRGRTAS